MRIAVCALTYRRPEGLERLLEGLSRLDIAGLGDVDVFIIDNDPEGSAAALCRAAQETYAHRLTYIHEPCRGIAHARNRAVEAARPYDALAFIDDDEIPDERWLAELVAPWQDGSADIVTGPVVPKLEGTPPAWVIEGGFFERPRLADGARMDRARTGNVLIAMDLLAGLREPFDPALALTGGEDTHLFRRLVQNGARIVWADRAVVTEFVPPARAEEGWLVRRMYRVGTATSAIERRLFGIKVVPALLARSAVWMLLGIVRWLVALLRGRARRVGAKRAFMYGWGLLAGLFGSRYEEYAAPTT